MEVLEANGQAEMWKVDMSAALQKRGGRAALDPAVPAARLASVARRLSGRGFGSRAGTERRHSFASQTTDKDEGIRRWLIELVSPAEHDDLRVKSASGEDTASDDSSALTSASFHSMDTSHEART